MANDITTMTTMPPAKPRSRKSTGTASAEPSRRSSCHTSNANTGSARASVNQTHAGQPSPPPTDSGYTRNRSPTTSSTAPNQSNRRGGARPARGTPPPAPTPTTAPAPAPPPDGGRPPQPPPAGRGG